VKEKEHKVVEEEYRRRRSIKHAGD